MYTAIVVFTYLSLEMSHYSLHSSFHILSFQSRTSKGVSDNTNNLALQLSSHEREPAYLLPQTDTAIWTSAIINCVIHTCAFPALTFQNVVSEKQQLARKTENTFVGAKGSATPGINCLSKKQAVTVVVALEMCC